MALGIGLWISALVETQQQAMFVTFFIVNIYLLMSGLFTPVDSRRRGCGKVSVRHFVTISRAIRMKGAVWGRNRAAVLHPGRVGRGRTRDRRWYQASGVEYAP